MSGQGRGEQKGWGLRRREEQGDDFIPYVFLSFFFPLVSGPRGLEDGPRTPLLLEKGETGRWTAKGDCMPESALLLQGAFDRTREPEGQPFCFVISFSQRVRVSCFSCSGALRCSSHGLGIMARIGKGTQDFFLSNGGSDGKAREKTASRLLLRDATTKETQFSQRPLPPVPLIGEVSSR